jgi:myo-inositol-1(or 4)-monophosphatase
MENMQKFILGMLKESGGLLVEMQKGARSQNKSEHDLVTDADMASEKLIISKIREEFPNHKIYSEEGERVNKDLFAPDCWVIDPLDGTNNYTYGFPIWGVSIAYAKKGEVVCGGLAFPMQGIYLTCEKGKGAFCHEEGKGGEFSNPKKIYVSKRNELKNFMVLVCAHLAEDSGGKHLSSIGKVAKNTFNFRNLGSAAFNLGYVAMGLADACVEFKLQPYDGAAGALMVKEAGGKITNLKGKEWKIDSKNMVCSNGKKHQELINAIGWE